MLKNQMDSWQREKLVSMELLEEFGVFMDENYFVNYIFKDWLYLGCVV